MKIKIRNCSLFEIQEIQEIQKQKNRIEWKFFKIRVFQGNNSWRFPENPNRAAVLIVWNYVRIHTNLSVHVTIYINVYKWGYRIYRRECDYGVPGLVSCSCDYSWNFERTENLPILNFPFVRNFHKWTHTHIWIAIFQLICICVCVWCIHNIMHAFYSNYWYACKKINCARIISIDRYRTKIWLSRHTHTTMVAVMRGNNSAMFHFCIIISNFDWIRTASFSEFETLFSQLRCVLQDKKKRTLKKIFLTIFVRIVWEWWWRCWWRAVYFTPKCL